MNDYPMSQGGEGRQLVAEPLRILLRLLGAVMVLLGSAAIVLLVYPGPFKVAEAMGQQCVHGEPGPFTSAEQCTVFDVIELTLAAPALVLVGLLLVFTMRRSFCQADPPGAAAVPLAIRR